MQDSKIRLSDAERRLFEDASVILTKNSILKKTALLLAEVQDALMQKSDSFKWTSSPKISRGENYLGLPYVILDYPRIANGNDLFFIRTLFWWGHFFSCTLQLSGRYAGDGRMRLAAAYETVSRQHYFIGISEDPWHHHFEETNYKKISHLTKDAFALVLEECPQIKIAAHWPLSDWDTAASKLIDSWMLLASLTA